MRWLTRFRRDFVSEELKLKLKTSFYSYLHRQFHVLQFWTPQTHLSPNYSGVKKRQQTHQNLFKPTILRGLSGGRWKTFVRVTPTENASMEWCTPSQHKLSDLISRSLNRWLCPWLQASLIAEACDINGSSPWEFLQHIQLRPTPSHNNDSTDKLKTVCWRWHA